MTSADGIAAAFPNKILEKINGTPSRIDIDNSQLVTAGHWRHNCNYEGTPKETSFLVLW